MPEDGRGALGDFKKNATAHINSQLETKSIRVLQNTPAHMILQRLNRIAVPPRWKYRATFRTVAPGDTAVGRFMGVILCDLACTEE